MARVLIVDDDPASLGLAVRVVEHAGHEVISASDGAAALALAQDARPPLILLDLHLPGMHGWEFVTAIRASAWSERVRVVAVSASASQADRLRALAVGCNEFLAKPYTLDALRDVVARQLGLAMVS